MKNYKCIICLVAIIATFFAINTAKGNAMNIFKSDFEQQWETLFKDVGKLNEYVALRNVTLRNAKVEDYNIDGAIFTGAIFDGVKWESMRASKSKFTKVVFKNCNFLSVNFEDSFFTDVERWSPKFGQCSKVGSRTLTKEEPPHEQDETYPLLSRVQSQGCPGSDQGRTDRLRTGQPLWTASQHDHQLETAGHREHG